MDLVKFMERIVFLGRKIQKIIGTFFLIMIIAVVTAGIIARYIFQEPFSWTEELVSFLFIWVALLAAGVAFAEDRHIKVELFHHLITPKARIYLKKLSYIIVLIILLYFILSSIKVESRMISLGVKSVVLGIPRYLFFIPILISSIYMCLVCVYKLVLEFLQGNKNQKKGGA